MTHGSNSSEQRLLAAVESLNRVGADAMLLGPGADLFYLTGFEHGHAGERLLAFVLRRDGSASWIVPAMNVPQVSEHVWPAHPIREWTDGETFGPALRAALAGVNRIAFDDNARSGFLLDTLAAAPGIRPSKASQVMVPLRARKSADELELLRAAGRTVDDTIVEAIWLCQPGATEATLDESLRAALLRRSPESTVAFTILASGPNSALPHHETARRPLAEGDMVTLDYGTRRKGYHSDITIDCSVGEPADPEVRRVYRTVWEAQQKALEASGPGIPCENVDRAARQHIEQAGYGDRFLHRTGHGLGLEIHEAPYIVAGNKELLEEGMVFSIEPGIYLPGRFGIRLEVIATITAGGVSLINAPSASELPVVPV